MGIRVEGVDSLVSIMENTVKNYNRESGSFLGKEGTKLKRVVTKIAKSRIKKKTGNYLKGISKQKPYTYYKSKGRKSKDSVKVYGKRPPAYHTHLIEDGHRKVLWGRRTEEWVKAFYIYRDAEKEYASTFEQNCDDFVEKCLNKLLD